MQLMWFEQPLCAVIVTMKLFLSAYKEASFYSQLKKFNFCFQR